ncbi:hypothetical protein [Streptomyces sp. NBC_01304]|uniref:hypothetical protein n=1 Tax=Streptomyces sp. NBC_01304 TaxID=2903818 RepID=UPI002E0E4C17|nr:hypothetical protein OG430_48855 [Streptomyces sp. NBC_01304]
MSTEEYVLQGAPNGGWTTTQSFDWVALCPGLSDGAYRLYMILRSLLTKHGPVRAITPEELRYLLTNAKGKPSSISRIRDLIRELEKAGLLSDPSGGTLRISDRKTAQTRRVSIQINDLPAKGERYRGWRNTYDALTHLREQAERARQNSNAPAPEDPSASEFQRDASEFQRDASEKRRDALDLQRAPSPENGPSPAQTPDAAEAPSSSSFVSSSSSSSSGSGASEPEQLALAEGQADDEETHSEEPQQAAPGVPTARVPAEAGDDLDQDGAGDQMPVEVQEFVAGLPGMASKGPKSQATLYPLTATAFANGWTSKTLAVHLAREVNPSQCRSVAAVYKRQLADLPTPPAAPAPRMVRPGRCEEHPEMSTEGGGCPLCPRETRPAGGRGRAALAAARS